MSPRTEAARIVARWLEQGTFPDRQVAGVETGRGAVTELVYGAVKQHRLLAWVLANCVEHPPTLPVAAVMLIGVYELLDLERAPHAAVNEAVLAVRQLGAAAQTGLVNAVLRRVSRERDLIIAAIAAQPPGVRLSHPESLLERWMARYTPAMVEALCVWNNSAPEVVLRVNLKLTTMAGFLEALAALGVAATVHPYAPDRCVVLPHGRRVSDMPGYDAGFFNVQDPSTLLAPDLLDAQPGERVLDACAAPGGKTTVLAEGMNGIGRLVAIDRASVRLTRLQATLDRTGFGTFVKVAEGDLTAGLQNLEEAPFDAILLDVPCTNTGVLRRRADARWRFSAEALAVAVCQQRALLDAAAGHLRPAGRIVYSTCSLEPDENEHQVRGWLADHPDFRLDVERRTFPPEDGIDGAYAARLIKITDC
ncbi:MAG: transcription antitermination factor NusB [bacterium]